MQKRGFVIIGVFILLFSVSFISGEPAYCGGLGGSTQNYAYNSYGGLTEEAFNYNGYNSTCGAGVHAFSTNLSGEGIVEFCKLFFYYETGISASDITFQSVSGITSAFDNYTWPYDETVWDYGGGDFAGQCNMSFGNTNVSCLYTTTLGSCAGTSICDSEGYECGTVFDCCSGTVDCGPTVVTNASCLGNKYVCDLGLDNCNSDWIDGCETDVSGDVDNCGTCGNVCSSGACVDGVCVATGLDFNYWADMNGVRFLEGDVVDFHDYVKFVSSSGPDYVVSQDDDIKGQLSVRYWRVGFSGDGWNFSSESGWSDNLINISELVGDSPLSIEVVSPSCGEYFDVGEIRSIEIVINDSDDLVSGNVSIGGLWIRDFDNIDGNIIVFNHTFSRSGNVGIVVFTNNTRGEGSKVTVNVMVVDTSKTDYYVASCIDEPKDFDRFTSSRVKFNASSTQALKFDVSNGSYNIIHRGVLKFNWRFFMANGEWGEPCVGLGSSRCPGSNEPIYSFHRNFPTVNDNKVFLTVSIPDSEL